MQAKTDRDYLRQVAIDTREGVYVLRTWETAERCDTGQIKLGYVFESPDGSTLFEGTDYGCSPMHGIDSDDRLLGLLGFLTLQPGDTDEEYFKDYTDDQRDWSQSSACENLSCDRSIAEEEKSNFPWRNLDDWGDE